MSDPFLGEIRAFGFNFAPRGWLACNGQTLSIAQNTALFALLGTTYGGDGQSTFALPDLRGRTAVSQGQGAGLSTRQLGGTYGAETTTLTQNQLPNHTHAVTASTKAANARASSNRPVGAIPATGGSYADPSDATGSGPAVEVTVAAAGGNQPFDRTPPTLVVNYCIATEGIFPSRP